MPLRVISFLIFVVCLTFQVQAQPVVVYETVVGDAVAIPVQERGDVVEYTHDDGAGNTNIGPPSTFDPDMLWGNYFFTQEGGEVIMEISAAFGNTWPSLEENPPTFWILDDPDMDADPRNATALMSIQATPDVSGNTFFTVEIPPTHVSGAFFVGVSAKLLGGQDRPARVDTDGPSYMAWFFYAPEIKDVINDLESAPFGTRMDNTEFVPFPGVFMIRAAGIPSLDSEPGPSPTAFALLPNYPNPFRDETTIRFDVPQAEHVTIEIFDLSGRLVTMLVDQPFETGSHSVIWNTRELAGGVYLCRMTAGGFVQSLRVTVVS